MWRDDWEVHELNFPTGRAFAAFGLAYHEPGAPRFSWLFLLIPVALVTVLPAGRWRNVAN